MLTTLFVECWLCCLLNVDYAVCRMLTMLFVECWLCCLLNVDYAVCWMLTTLFVECWLRCLLNVDYAVCWMLTMLFVECWLRCLLNVDYAVCWMLTMLFVECWLCCLLNVDYAVCWMLTMLFVECWLCCLLNVDYAVCWMLTMLFVECWLRCLLNVDYAVCWMLTTLLFSTQGIMYAICLLQGLSPELPWCLPTASVWPLTTVCWAASSLDRRWLHLQGPGGCGGQGQLWEPRPTPHHIVPGDSQWWDYSSLLRLEGTGPLHKHWMGILETLHGKYFRIHSNHDNSWHSIVTVPELDIVLWQYENKRCCSVVSLLTEAGQRQPLWCGQRQGAAFLLQHKQWYGPLALFHSHITSKVLKQAWRDPGLLEGTITHSSSPKAS